MITKTNQSLSNIFDVEPSTGEIIESKPEIKVDSTVQDTDFEIARTTMHNLLLKGQSALENAILIANGTEEPESYNAVSALIAKMTDTSVKLMGLHEIKSKLAIKSPSNLQTPNLESTTTNISSQVVFVGSTSEMAKAIFDTQKLNK